MSQNLQFGAAAFAKLNNLRGYGATQLSVSLLLHNKVETVKMVLLTNQYTCIVYKIMTKHYDHVQI